MLRSKEFFGKVKNKAGDVEKILKEKDKHGLMKLLRVFRVHFMIIII